VTQHRYTVTVTLTVNEEPAQGDEADLFHEHIVDSMQNFGLAGCSYTVSHVTYQGQVSREELRRRASGR
jgi:hypothetical protein